MSKDEPISPNQKRSGETEDVSIKKTLLIAMLTDMNPNMMDFAANKKDLAYMLSDEDYEMLEFVISDVLDHQDIIVKYPQFYKKLLEDAFLRQTFLETLQALDTEGNSDSINWELDNSDLSFLDDIEV